MNKEARGRNEETNRKARIPLGTQRRRLSLSHDKEEEMKFRGVVPRWINDRGDRLSEAQVGGYSFETDSKTASKVGDVSGSNDIAASPGVDTRIRRRVGYYEAGNPVYAYLMTIPQDIFDADQELKMKEIDDIEKGMLGGKGKDGKQIPGTYVPTTGDGGPKIEYRDTE